jgi:hypothetical protein
MRLLPAALRNLLFYRLMPGLRMACTAQVGPELGIVCVDGTALFYLRNNELSRINGCSTRRLFAQSRTATASHYPRLRVTLVAIREEHRPAHQPAARRVLRATNQPGQLPTATAREAFAAPQELQRRLVNGPPQTFGWLTDPPRFSAQVQIKRRRRIDMPVATRAERAD